MFHIFFIYFLEGGLLRKRCTEDEWILLLLAEGVEIVR